MWQIDWTTWANDLRMSPYRRPLLQLSRGSSRAATSTACRRSTAAGRRSKIGWPKGTPPTQPTGYFGPMVGFRKEITREENLEIIPIGTGGGNVDLRARGLERTAR